LDPKNHADQRPPEIMSHHAYLGMQNGQTNGEAFFHSVDDFVKGTIVPLVAQRDLVAPDTEMVLNEWIPFITDWCDPNSTGADGGCPNWQDPASKGIGPNRATLGWNAGAASFAYGYGLLALQRYLYVGADQLVGGPWPDNEPAVASMDWKTGEPNAKFWAVKMIAEALGTQKKDLLTVTYTGSGSPPAGTHGNGTCGATSFGGDCDKDSKGAWNAKDLNITTLAQCVQKAQTCTQANFVSFSYFPAGGNFDCSWYAECDFEHLCVDCSKCGIGCPQYLPYESQVLHAVKPHPSNESDAVFALPYRLLDDGRTGVLVVNKKENTMTVTLSGKGLAGAEATVLEGVGSEPGFQPPVARRVGDDGLLSLGPYAIAIVVVDV